MHAYLPRTSLRRSWCEAMTSSGCPCFTSPRYTIYSCKHCRLEIMSLKHSLASNIIPLQVVVTTQLLAGMLTLRDPPCTPSNSTKKRSSSAEDAEARHEEQNPMLFSVVLLIGAINGPGCLYRRDMHEEDSICSLGLHKKCTKGLHRLQTNVVRSFNGDVHLH